LDNPKIVLRNTKEFGLGVFTKDALRKNEFICEFDGQIYDDYFEPWTQDLLNHTIQIGPAIWRDSKGLARYMNHSCEPNCGFDGKFRIVAMRDIKAGEHLTWDYEMSELNELWKLRCLCGLSSCRGIIGNHLNMPEATRLKYRGYLSAWITELYTKKKKAKKK
jgi:uncharacterized protein